MKGGRKRESSGINYPFKTLEKSPDEIDFDKFLDNDGENIYVLTHQPGVGKTTAVLDYLKKKISEDDEFSFFYFTDKHETIEEHLHNKFEEGEVLHWKGFEKVIHDEKAIRLYKEYHLDIRTIKALCGVRKEEINEYYSQFNKSKKIKRVFAPFNYLYSKYFTESLPKIVFLDENISQIVTFSINSKTAEALSRICPEEGKEWAKKVVERDFKYFKNDELLNKIINLYKQSVEKAIEENDRETLEILKEFNPYEFKEYIRWGGIYGWKENSYGFPMYYYNAFDVVLKDIPIVILDATFNKYLFSYFLESYNGEVRSLGETGFKDLNVYIFNKHRENKNTVIYRMHPSGAWSRSSVIDYLETTKEAIAKEIREIIEVFGIENIGIITFKEIAEIAELFGFDVEYFGNLRGTNKLSEKPVLIIIGTWLPPPPSWAGRKDEGGESLDDLVWKIFLIKIDENDVKDASVTVPQIVYQEYKNLQLAKAHITVEKNFTESDNLAEVAEKNPVSMINLLFFSEIYQAYHRNRGLRWDRIIFSYGWFPEPEMLINEGEGEDPFIKYDLRGEFRIEKLFSFTELNEILDEHQDAFKKWRNLLLQIENTKSNTEIARRNRIWRGPGQGPDNIAIEKIRKVQEIFKSRRDRKV